MAKRRHDEPLKVTVRQSDEAIKLNEWLRRYAKAVVDRYGVERPKPADLESDQATEP